MKKGRKLPPKVLKVLGATFAGLPQVEEFLCYTIQYIGGPQALAKKLVDEFNSAKPGSLIRQRFMDGILKLLRWVNDRSMPNDDLGMLSEADLEREIQEAIEKLTPTNATQETVQEPEGPASQEPAGGPPSTGTPRVEG